MQLKKQEKTLEPKHINPKTPIPNPQTLET